MIDKRIQEHAENYSQLHNLPVQLVLAIIMTESTGNTWALRTEPDYRYLVDITTGLPFRPLEKEERTSERAPKDFPYDYKVSSRNTEWMGQQASWGCMQVMGATAREYGFKDAFPRLCDPAQGIFYACAYLSNLRDRWLERYGWAGVAAAYNAGSVRFQKGTTKLVNEEYVQKVSDNGAAEVFRAMCEQGGMA